MVIGRYGILTVEEARKQAKKILAAVLVGKDPAYERVKKRSELTVEQLVELYARSGVSHMKLRTARYTIARLRHHVVPLLGSTRVSNLRTADVGKFTSHVAEGKTAANYLGGPRRRIIVKGGIGAAAKVVRDLSAMYSFAQRHEFVGHNPCAQVQRVG
jgi:hypothetical protein